MTIINKMNVNTAKAMYAMTKSPDRQKLSDHKGEIVKMDAWIIYTAEDAAGNEMEIMSIQSADAVLTTNSKTFIREFKDALAMFDDVGETFDSIKVVAGKTKAGRDFLTCAVV